MDMANPTTKKVVFRGYAREAYHSDPVKEDKLLSKALDKMFKGFSVKGRRQANLSQNASIF